jgi:hypothetical protein
MDGRPSSVVYSIDGKKLSASKNNGWGRRDLPLPPPTPSRHLVTESLKRLLPAQSVRYRCRGFAAAAAESHNQQLFALRWRIGLSRSREATSYDPAISLALLPLLGKDSLNAFRLNGEAAFRTEDPLDSVSYIACNAQETTPELRHGA